MKTNDVKILLVEDNPFERELAIRSFKASGYEGLILTAGDGLEALEILSGDNALNLKLALIDLKLPKLDGVQVIRAIRSSTRTKHLPVIAFSSSDDQNDMRESYNAGADRFVTKPIRYDDMEKIIAELSMYWKD